MGTVVLSQPDASALVQVSYKVMQELEGIFWKACPQFKASLDE